MFELGNAYKNQLIDNYAENKYCSDSLVINMKDKNNSKVIITNYVDKNSRCLDVGCGVGYLGEVLRKHKDAEVYGIDLDKKALKYAAKKKCFKKLYNFSIIDRGGDEFDKFCKDKPKFDYIIFADVLEHIVNIEEVLLFFSEFLMPKGEIIISLPNVAHFDIVRGLVNGKFNYNHIGLLDNTHLRFFTKSSFRDFVQQLNEVYGQSFSLKEIGRTIVKPDYIGNYPGMYKLLNKNKQACVLQYIYALSPGRQIDNHVNKEEDCFDELERIVFESEKNKSEYEQLSARIVELEEGINKVYTSRSWKLTKPIRGISRIAKKIKGDKTC